MKMQHIKGNDLFFIEQYDMEFVSVLPVSLLQVLVYSIQSSATYGLPFLIASNKHVSFVVVVGGGGFFFFFC